MRKEICKHTGLPKEKVDKLFNEGLITPKSGMAYLVKKEYQSVKSKYASKEQAVQYLSDKFGCSMSTIKRYI